MKFTKYLAVVAALSLTAGQALATKAAPISSAKSLRVGAPTAKKSELAGGGIVVAIIAAAAVVAGIIIVADDDDDSN